MEKKKILNIISIVMGAVALIALLAVIIVFIKGVNTLNEEPKTTTATDNLLEARKYCENGDYTKAVDSYKLVEDERMEEQDRYNLANAYFEQKDFINALNYSYEYLDTAKDTSMMEKIYTLVADCYVKAGNYKAAYNLLDKSGVENLLESYCDSKTDLLITLAPYETEEEGYIYLGSYPQTGYEEKEIPDYIEKFTFDEDGYAMVYGVEYVRVKNGEKYTYYPYEPVKWKVLENGEEGMHLLSDMILDSRPYSNTFKAVTWDNSDLRQWINEKFYNECFSDAEKKYIECRTTQPAWNYFHNFTTGVAVDDYIRLLSCQELAYGRYDFDLHTSVAPDPKRKAFGTDYAINSGLYIDEYNYAPWWTMTSAGVENTSTVIITEEGFIMMESGGIIVNKRDIGVRPFIIIKSDYNK